MAEFTPPTYSEYFAPLGVDRLWSRVPFPRAQTVLYEPGIGVTVHTIIDSDRLIAAQQDEGSIAWVGSHTYDLTSDEEALLVDGTPVVTDEEWPGWLL